MMLPFGLLLAVMAVALKLRTRLLLPIHSTASFLPRAHAPRPRPLRFGCGFAALRPFAAKSFPVLVSSV